MSLPWHFRIVSPGLAKATAGNCYSQLSLLYFEVLLLDLKCLFSGREEQWLFSTPLLLFLHSSSTFCSAWATPQGPSMRGLPVGRVAAPVIFFFFSWLGKREGVCWDGELNNRGVNSSFILFKLFSSPVSRHTGFYFSVVPWQRVSGVAKYHGRLPICNANEVVEYVLLWSFFMWIVNP